MTHQLLAATINASDSRSREISQRLCFSFIWMNLCRISWQFFYVCIYSMSTFLLYIALLLCWLTVCFFTLHCFKLLSSTLHCFYLTILCISFLYSDWLHFVTWLHFILHSASDSFTIPCCTLLNRLCCITFQYVAVHPVPLIYMALHYIADVTLL